MKKTPQKPSRLERQGQRRWVKLADCQINPLAQRELKQAFVDRLVADFDLEQIGIPIANHRNGVYHIVDGQHRVAALLHLGFDDYEIEMEVYEGLTSPEEARMFLQRNNTLQMAPMAKFHASVHGEIPEFVAADRAVRAAGAAVTASLIVDVPRIQGVAAVMKVYYAGGAELLTRSVRLCLEIWPAPQVYAPQLGGMSLVIQRYGDALDEAELKTQMAKPLGAYGAMGHAAERLRAQFGGTKAGAFAAAIVEQYNRKRGGPKLEEWWKG